MPAASLQAEEPVSGKLPDGPEPAAVPEVEYAPTAQLEALDDVRSQSEASTL